MTDAIQDARLAVFRSDNPIASRIEAGEPAFFLTNEQATQRIVNGRIRMFSGHLPPRLGWPHRVEICLSSWLPGISLFETSLDIRLRTLALI
ncbi:hypothetical protein ACAX43_31175 [Paraburkholderia sp. IW21]|uniref:hypothetical protein n=1 Tax=Paraburkholderia sp. IW21 TaxID=3242488 RepID=UPI003522A7DF